MVTQTYYHTTLEADANICDLTVPIKVNCAGSVCSDTGIHTTGKRQDYYLIYVIAGDMVLHTPMNHGEIRQGQFIILSPGIPYEYQSRAGDELNYLWIHFTGSEVQTLLNKLGIIPGRMENPGVHNALMELWRQLFREFMTHDSFFEVSSPGVLAQILTRLVRFASSPGRTLMTSLAYIHRKYHTPLSVANLAEMEHLSEAHYRAVFKTLTGTTPNSYIIDRRMAAACHMLESTDCSMEEIAHTVGYSDVYYFGRIFRARVGISPGRYRRVGLSKQ